MLKKKVNCQTEWEVRCTWQSDGGGCLVAGHHVIQKTDCEEALKLDSLKYLNDQKPIENTVNLMSFDIQIKWKCPIIFEPWLHLKEGTKPKLK